MTVKRPMKCSECRDLITSYALDALTGNEREQVRAHLESGCQQCAAELNDVEALLAHLPLTLDPVVPSVEIKSRLMNRIQADRESPEVMAGQNLLRSPPPRRRWRWAEPLAAAAAAVAVTMSVLWVEIDQQRGRITALRDEVLRQEARVDQLQTTLDQEGNTIHLFASPAVQLVSLQGSAEQPGAKARAFWDKDRNVIHLYASGLKPLAQDKAYELWFIDAEQKKIPGGTFKVNPRGEASLVATPLPSGGRIAALAVTEEPAGGSPSPTGQIQLLGKPG